MATFTFSAAVTVSAFTTVEASTYEEALEIAKGREISGLCNQPFDIEEGEAWHIDIDGEPLDITGG